MSDDRFAGLNFLIQYRRKDDGVAWHNMAAFDVSGPAEKYFRQQDTEDCWPWEYQLVDLHAGTTVRQSPQATETSPTGEHNEHS